MTLRVDWPYEALKAQITQIIESNAVSVHWVEGVSAAECEPFTRTVWLPEPISPQTYVAALHELGHILDDTSNGLQHHTGVRSALACEAYAWGWAYEHLDPSVADECGTAPVRRFVGSCLGSHWPPHAVG